MNDFEILAACWKDLPNWMSTNSLHLNEWKTEIGVFWSVVTLKAKFSQFQFDLKPHVKNQGYVIRSHFKMDKQVNSIVMS